MERNLKKGIEIVIMCRDRPTETLRAISAIQKIHFGVDTRIIVSDNASTLEKALTGLPAGVEHRLRSPAGSWNWHFNKIVSELKYEWCLITHDDDEILPTLGQLFSQHHEDERVSTITGISQIIDSDRGPIVNELYEMRIKRAGLCQKAGTVNLGLAEKLFDLGTLFPASAMIIRTSLLKSLGPLDARFEWTADYGLSILVAYGKGVIFEGIQPVMNYHLHKNNSVFSDEAAGGIKSDFTVTRILLLDRYPEFYDLRRANRLIKDVFVSKILASAFGLESRKKLLSESIKSSRVLRRSKIRYLLMRIPINVYPFAGLIRKIVRNRIGI